MGESRLGPAPGRPASIELAAAILIIGGVFRAIEVYLGGLGLIGSLPSAQALNIVELALDAVSIYLGIQIRSGRSWGLTLNVAAIYAFLMFAALPNVPALVFGVGHMYVVGVLIARRPWFDAMRAWRAGELIESGVGEDDSPWPEHDDADDETGQGAKPTTS